MPSRCFEQPYTPSRRMTPRSPPLDPLPPCLPSALHQKRFKTSYTLKTKLTTRLLRPVVRACNCLLRQELDIVTDAELLAVDLPDGPDTTPVGGPELDVDGVVRPPFPPPPPRDRCRAFSNAHV